MSQRTTVGASSPPPDSGEALNLGPETDARLEVGIPTHDLRLTDLSGSTPHLWKNSTPIHLSPFTWFPAGRHTFSNMAVTDCEIFSLTLGATLLPDSTECLTGIRSPALLSLYYWRPIIPEDYTPNDAKSQKILLPSALNLD